jgi:trk system potassium uptake protein TrkA
VKIVIIGAGAVGFDLARTISEREHDVVVVEQDAERLADVQEQLDCRLVLGNGINPRTLQEIGMKDCDLCAAVSNRDEINIISCLTAHRLGARVKVARVRQEDYYVSGRLVLDGIDLALNPDHEAVHAIREILFQTGATDVHEFAGGHVRIIGARVEPQSYVAGRTLREIDRDLGGRIALVTTIVRGEETLIPRGDTVIEPDDLIYFTGSRPVVDRSLYYIHAQQEPLSRVMIAGANPMGRELARDLLANGVKVKLIDRSEEKCRAAAEQLHRALVLHGDAADSELLASEGVADMDGFVSVSSDEETNIMACLLARHLGARKTVCLVDRPDYVPLLPLLGVDAAVSPRLSAAAWIARFVKRGAVVSAERLGTSGAEFLQFRLGPKGKVTGKRLQELGFPRQAVVGAVFKRGRVVTPRGDTLLEPGDEVVVFALPDGVAAVENFFAEG